MKEKIVYDENSNLNGKNLEILNMCYIYTKNDYSIYTNNTITNKKPNKFVHSKTVIFSSSVIINKPF